MTDVDQLIAYIELVQGCHSCEKALVKRSKVGKGEEKKERRSEGEGERKRNEKSASVL